MKKLIVMSLLANIMLLIPICIKGSQEDIFVKSIFPHEFLQHNRNIQQENFQRIFKRWWQISRENRIRASHENMSDEEKMYFVKDDELQNYMLIERLLKEDEKLLEAKKELFVRRFPGLQLIHSIEMIYNALWVIFNKN